MNREDDEQLWELLGCAKTPPPSPFFARNVLRQVREESGRKSTLRSWFGLRRLVPATGLTVAVLAAMLLVHRPELPTKATDPDSELIAQIDPQDYEVVVDLDELLASEENNLWDENSSL